MSANGDEDLFIQQRRFLSFLCGAILLIIGLSFVAVPILTFFILIEATHEEQLYFRICSFIMALVLGCPLIIMSICLVANVRHKVAIRANKEGMYIHTDAFKKGFISWTAVEYMYFHKSYMTRRYGRTLEVILNTDEKPTVRINAVWRLESKILRTKMDNVF